MAEPSLLKKILTFIPIIFALAYVALSAITYVYIETSRLPEDSESKVKMNTARYTSMSNLVLSVIALSVIVYIYYKSLKIQTQTVMYPSYII